MSNTPWFAATISLVVALITSIATFLVQERRLTRESKRQLELQAEKLRTELRTEFMAEEAIKQLLNHPRWERQRSFAAIKDRIGGFDDDELRKLLVRAGAVKFKRRDDGAELWGLRERNEGEL